MATDLTETGAESFASWRQPLLEAAIISALVLGLFYYWFGIADRYIVFLYGHSAGGPPAQPFDETTSGRYWMSGLVAAAILMVLYTSGHWLLSLITRRSGRFHPSPWWQVWLLSTIPLGIGIPALTMTVNSPTLPLTLAAACALATLLGLAVALLPARWTAERPLDLLWLAADGIGLIPPLTLLHAVEYLSRRETSSAASAWLLIGGTILAGIVWLIGMSLLRVWRRKEAPGAAAIFLAGLALSYLVLPLLHYLLAAAPNYYYISAAENFFASSLSLQLLALIVAATIALGVTGLRRGLAKSHTPPARSH